MPENVPLTKSEVGVPVAAQTDDEMQNAPGVVEFAGNHKDDDGLAIDQYFEAADLGPEEYMGVIPVAMELPTTNRLVRAGYFFTGQFQSVRVLPPDPTRKHLYLRVFSPTAGAFALYAGDQFGVPGPNADQAVVNASFIPIPAANTMVSVTIDDYTGPLYVANYDANSVRFEIVAVQE